MRLCNSSDIFQKKINELMAGLNFARAYLDALLLIAKENFDKHLEQLEMILTRLSEASLATNLIRACSVTQILNTWDTRLPAKE